jgi:hypothetical protein
MDESLFSQQASKQASKQASRGEFLHHHMADVWHLYSSAANDTRNPPSRFSQILAMTQDELANHELLMREEDLEHLLWRKKVVAARHLSNSRRATAILVVELIESKIMRHLERKFLY